MEKEIIEQNKMILELENYFERFPLPICFDPHEERRELYTRKLRIQELVKRFIKIKNKK